MESKRHSLGQAKREKQRQEERLIELVKEVDTFYETWMKTI